MVDEVKYMRLVGNLIYLCNTWPNTQLDISYATSVLSRFSTKPRENHWRIGMRVLKYISGTLDYGIHYLKDKAMKLIGYSDSDWGNSIDHQNSTSGNYFSLGSSLVT